MRWARCSSCRGTVDIDRYSTCHYCGQAVGEPRVFTPILPSAAEREAGRDFKWGAAIWALLGGAAVFAFLKTMFQGPLKIDGVAVAALVFVAVVAIWFQVKSRSSAFDSSPESGVRTVTGVVVSVGLVVGASVLALVAVGAAMLINFMETCSKLGLITAS